jgi:hypothetical protein
VFSGSSAGNLDSISGRRHLRRETRGFGVGETDIRECWAKYRKAIDLYSRILDKLEAARDAAEGVPILRRAQRHIEEALHDISCLGDLMSLVPELTTRLQAQTAQLRLAVLLRESPIDVECVPLDIEEPEEEPDETTEGGA